MKTYLKQTIYLISFLCLLVNLEAQNEQAPILFIYDASGSMWGKLDQTTKMKVASDVLSSSVQNLTKEQKIGLMAYGHNREKDCNDVEMLVNLDNTSKNEIINAISGIKPLGRTPLARSASLAIEQLKLQKTKATIILITDGIESCDGNICDVVSQAKSDGIEFRLHIVGFGLKDENIDQLKCAASAGNGKYFEATDASGLGDVIDEAVNETVEEIANNVSFYALKNGEAIDAWIRPQNVSTKELVGASRTYQDTSFTYLEAGSYIVKVQPLAGSDISPRELNITVEEGVPLHTTISFDGANIHVYATNNEEGCDAVVKIYDSTTGKVAATTRTYGRKKTVEVDPGQYRVHYQALKIEGTKTKYEESEVNIEAGEELELSHNFETGIAFIGAQTSQGELIDATVNIKELGSGAYVGGSRTYTKATNNPRQFVLNPGKYSVKVVTLGKHKGNETSFEMEIKTGETTKVIKTF